jgi:hypothetical protein
VIRKFTSVWSNDPLGHSQLCKCREKDRMVGEELYEENLGYHTYSLLLPSLLLRAYKLIQGW